MVKNAQSKYQKMIYTPVSKLVITLAIPTILSMLISSIYNLVDTGFVSSLGTSASGAVGVVFGYMAILQAVGFLFGQGSGSIIARKLGEKKEEDAHVVASTGFAASLVISIILEILTFVFMDKLVYRLGSTQTIAPYAKDYITWIALAAPFLILSFTMNSILRYEGKAFLGMIGMMSGAVMNIGGDALFIFGFKMGISGAGLSTAISQVVGFSILLYMFLSGKTASKLSPKYLKKWTFRLFVDIFLTGFPSLVRQVLNSITTVLLNSEARYYGDAAVSGMSIASRITMFTFSIALGIGQGFQPVSSFNYGAGQYSRVRKAYKFTTILSTAVIVVFCVGLEAMPEFLVSRLIDDSVAVEIGTRALRLQALAQVILPFCVATEMACQSTGKKLFATTLSMIRNGVFFIPALIILSDQRGLSGIQEAQPAAQVLSVLPVIVICIIYFAGMPKTDKPLSE